MLPEPVPVPPVPNDGGCECCEEGDLCECECHYLYEE